MLGLLAVDTLLVFVGIPVLAACVLGVLVYASTIADGPRYRPGLPWFADSVWIVGPDQQLPTQTSTQASTQTSTDAASKVTTQTAMPAIIPPAAGSVPASRTDRTGGASARW